MNIKSEKNQTYLGYYPPTKIVLKIKNSWDTHKIHSAQNQRYNFGIPTKFLVLKIKDMWNTQKNSSENQ
jgi:hypothetical protein